MQFTVAYCKCSGNYLVGPNVQFCSSLQPPCFIHYPSTGTIPAEALKDPLAIKCGNGKPLMCGNGKPLLPPDNLT